MKKVSPTGPSPSQILIVGEAPGRTEEEQGIPFIGGSGQLLSRLLSSAGIDRAACRITNVVPYRPPNNDILEFFVNKTEAKKRGLLDPELELKSGTASYYPTPIIYDGLQELYEEIERTKPKVIIPLGNTALWAVMNFRDCSVDKWAGSMLQAYGAWVIPTHHPARVLRQMALKNITVRDLSRAKLQLRAPVSPPTYDFTTFPTFHETIEFLEGLLAGETGLLSCDIETTSNHEIGCIGFGISETKAFCIPFIGEDHRAYWTIDDEIEIISRIRELFARPDIRIVGQNFAFDAQYIFRNYLSLPRPGTIEDTMVGHHLCYPGTPKGLDYLSRLYLPFHVYWKDEGKFIDEKRDLGQWYEYNCKDCCVTLAVWNRIEAQINQFGLVNQYRFQMKMWHRLLYAMLRGVNINQSLKNQYTWNVHNRIQELNNEMLELTYDVIPSKGKTPWWNSPTQTANVFYNLLHYPTQYHKKTKRPSTDDDALVSLRKKDPMLWPIVDRILAIRSLGVFSKNFLAAGLGIDGRMRCTYALTGTETFRLASSKDAFGAGTNLQNIPRSR
jgi:DNA polymerase